MRRVYNVQARWDGEGGVWVAESEDVPGLVAEAESERPGLSIMKFIRAA